jgi:hypothetical protein
MQQTSKLTLVVLAGIVLSGAAPLSASAQEVQAGPVEHISRGLTDLASGIGHLVYGFAYPVTAPIVVAAYPNAREWNCSAQPPSHWCHRRTGR